MRKKRKKKPVKKVILNPICGLCVEYQEAPDYRRRTGGVRECLKIKDEVEYKTEACDQFSLVTYTFCDRNEQRIHLDVCINRQENKVCKRCSQGKRIKSVVDKLRSLV